MPDLAQMIDDEGTGYLGVTVRMAQARVTQLRCWSKFRQRPDNLRHVARVRASLAEQLTAGAEDHKVSGIQTLWATDAKASYNN